jgi:hypothetical protein
MEHLVGRSANKRRKTMQQIECSRLIVYRWWRDSENEIKPEHIPALEECAEERIDEMMGQGFTSGDMHDNIHMTDNDPEDGIEYTGWWEGSTTRAAIAKAKGGGVERP